MNKIAFVLSVGILISSGAFAGNEDRAGQSGAGEILINPWARASSWGSANSGFVHGVESMNSNIGGLSFIKGTEIVFAHTEWLKGTDVRIESFGLGQKVGESGALGLSVRFGDLGDDVGAERAGASACGDRAVSDRPGNTQHLRTERAQQQ